MKCSLCAGTLFREDEDGPWCKNCGASMGGPPSDRWSPFNDPSDLPAITREDSDALLDMLAAEGGTYRDRSFGG